MCGHSQRLCAQNYKCITNAPYDAFVNNNCEDYSCIPTSKILHLTGQAVVKNNAQIRMGLILKMCKKNVELHIYRNLFEFNSGIWRWSSFVDLADCELPLHY